MHSVGGGILQIAVVQQGYFQPFTVSCFQAYTACATKNFPAFHFATYPCSLALVCILRRVFEQLVNSRAVTISPTHTNPQ